ncbi:D-alanyl-D-alanine carboxypeptidase/D-alanyl-D-alanine-endopeptidase [Myxosarcina sp. GI1]|uniref:D-alanyl-D-alanine carboxypeptidase/D-alanyl-D-alanine endopeptidase n=1 Tax=Myxosarcina sp. GI1 TaxID=1541065 RepID=UPI000689A0DC|nr:D-alanyl-D-alanine carboxypeptidase/D-alanyl-D-alanine-endopeptidase [Myxosarcina sp. GI1]
MRWFTLGAIYLLLSLISVPVAALTDTQVLLAADRGRVCPQNLSAAINKIIARPKIARSHWGIIVQTLDSQHTLYSRHANKFFIPASTTKLFTTAAALIELGVNYRIHTPIFGLGNPPNLTYLRLEGRGDPTISSISLKKIVHLLRARGIERIENLILEDSYFTLEAINPTWEWSDVYSYYGTAVNSAILNENSVTLTLLPQHVGQKVKLRWSDAIAARQWQVENNAVTAPKDTPYNINIAGVLGKPVLNVRGELAIDEPPDVWDLAIADPPQYFLETWRHLLTVEGIDVAKTTVSNSRAKNILEREITAIVSPPLTEIITTINRESNNLYAESLWRILERRHHNLKTNPIEFGLNKLGIEPHNYQLIDGSGLSRHNLITPQAVVDVLFVMSRSHLFTSYKNSLAVAGTNGTLKRRFQHTPIQNKLWGKTGTLSGVAALSGYLYLSRYQPLVFTIIVNNSERASKELRQAIDEIVLLLGQLQKCQTTSEGYYLKASS